MVDEKFQQSAIDHSLFIKIDGSSLLALLVYVDDIIIASNDDIVIAKLKETLDARFKLKDLGSLRFFLGLDIVRSPKEIAASTRHVIP